MDLAPMQGRAATLAFVGVGADIAGLAAAVAQAQVQLAGGGWPVHNVSQRSRISRPAMRISNRLRAARANRPVPGSTSSMPASLNTATMAPSRQTSSMLQGRSASSQRMHTLNAGERLPFIAKLNTQINSSNWKTGAMMMEMAATSAMNVIGPWASATTESHNVALLFRPCRLMLITG